MLKSKNYRVGIGHLLTILTIMGIATIGTRISSATTYNVVTYGADPTGQTDSTPAVRAAISTAQVVAGNTVYFPAGRYILNDNDGAGIDFVLSTNQIIIQGAGRDTTTLVEEIGAKEPGYPLSKVIFEIVSGGKDASGNLLPGGADGTTIKGLTLDSGSYDAGTTILDYANNTTISNLTIYGPLSYPPAPNQIPPRPGYNRDQFGVRVIAICNHTNEGTMHHYGNTVDNLIIIGHGKAGNTDLDISCQEGASVSHITDTGNGIDIYIANNTSLTHYTYHPGTIQATPKSYIITGPTDGTIISHVTTYGSGGVLQPSPAGYVISNTSISYETMMVPGFNLVIGDAAQTTIDHSALGTIAIQPQQATNGVTVTKTTLSGTPPVTCNNVSLITGLSGISCP